VIGFDLYGIDEMPEGRVPTKLNTEPLALEGRFADLRGFSPPFLEDDPVAPALEGAPSETEGPVEPWFHQTWIDFLAELPRSVVRPCCRPPVASSAPPGDYLLVGLLESGGRDGTIVAQQRAEWTDADRAKRDENLRKALDEIRRRGLTGGLPGGLSYDDLMKHVSKLTADEGQVGAGTHGRTWPGPAHGETGKHTSTITINGNSALDLDPEQLIAVVVHELAHAAINLDLTVPANLKDVALQRVTSEVAAYKAVWDLIKAEKLQLRPFWQAMEALEAITSLMRYWRGFAAALAESGAPVTAAQRQAIRDARAAIRDLLGRYRAVLADAPAAAPLPKVTGPNGREMSGVECIDYLLEHAFK
jgi:hypothetical protein